MRALGWLLPIATFLAPMPVVAEPNAFTQGPDYALVKVPGKLALDKSSRASLRGGPYSATSADGTTVIAYGGAHGLTIYRGLRRGKLSKGRVIQGPRYYRVVLSPDGARFLAGTEEGDLSFFSSDGAAPERTVHLERTSTGGEIALAGPVALWFSGCQLFAVAPAAEAKAIGPRFCTAGDGTSTIAAFASRAPVLMVAVATAEGWRHQPPRYAAIHTLDAAGKGGAVLEDAAGYTDPALSPGGDRVCAPAADRSLRCAAPGKKALLVSAGPVGRGVTFDPTGRRVAFAVKAGPVDAIQLADLEARTVRKLDDAPEAWMSFVAAGTRLALYPTTTTSARGLFVYDLAKSRRFSHEGNEEFGGAVDLPGDLTHFVLGIEGKGRQLVIAELP